MYIKNTKELFKKLNITKKTLTNRQKFLLKHKGFLILNRSKVMKSNLKAFQEIAIYQETGCQNPRYGLA